MALTGSVAELFATLGIDSTYFNQELRAAEASLLNLSNVMAGEIGKMSLLWNSLATSSATSMSMVQAQIRELSHAGLSGSEATAAAIAQMNKLHKESMDEVLRISKEQAATKAAEAASDKELAALNADYRAQEIAGARAVASARETARKAADKVETAQIRSMLAADKEAAALRVSQEKLALSYMSAREAEYSALWISLLNDRDAAEKAAGLRRVAVENEIHAAVVASAQREYALKVKYAEESEAAQTAAAKEGSLARIRIFGGAGGIRPIATVGGASMGGMIAGGVALFGGYEVLKQATQFNEALNKSISIMDDASDHMQGSMRNAAMSLAAQYGVSSKEIVGSLYDLKSAGLSAQQSLEALPKVVQFAFVSARDGAVDVKKAAESLTTIYNALQGTGGSIEHIANLLVQADRLAVGTGEQFAQSLAGKAAGSMKILNMSLEDGLALMMTLYRVGITGSNATNAFVQILRDFGLQAQKHKDVQITVNDIMQTFSQIVYDGSGKMRNMADILGDLDKAMAGASDQTKVADISSLGFQQRTTQSLRAVVGMNDVLKDYQKGMKAGGTALDEVTGKRMDSAIIQFNRLREAVKNAAIQLGEGLAPGFGWVSKQAANAIENIRSMVNIAEEAARLAGNWFIGKSPQPFAPATSPFPSTPSPVSLGGSIHDPAADEKATREREKAAGERNAIRTIEINSQAKVTEEALTGLKKEMDAQATLGLVTIKTNLETQLALNKLILENAEWRVKTLLALEEDGQTKLGKVRLGAQMQEIGADSKKANQADSLRYEEEEKKQADVFKKIQEGLTLYYRDALDNRKKAYLAYLDSMFERDNIVLAHDLKVTDDKLKALQIQEDAEMDHQLRLVDMDRKKADIDLRNHKITIAQHQDLYNTYSAIEEMYQRGAIQRMIDMLDKEKDGYYSEKARLEAQLAKLGDDIRARNIAGMQTEMREQVKALNYIQRQAQEVFRSVGSAAASLMVDGGRWADKAMDVVKTLARVIITDLVQYAFGKLLIAIAGTKSSLAGLKAIGEQLANIFGGAASSAGGAAAGAAGSAGGTAAAGAATGSKGIAGAASGILGWVSAIGSVGTMISSIFGNIQNVKMEKTLGLIESNTRGLLNVVFSNGAGTLVDCAIRSFQELVAIHTLMLGGSVGGSALPAGTSSGGFNFINCTFGSGSADEWVLQVRRAGGNI